MPTIHDSDLGLVSVRAKFFVAKVEFYNESSRLVIMKAVYSEDPRHENKQLWYGMPNGEITMTINDPRAAEFFVPGHEYYIDFVNPPKMADLTARDEVERATKTTP